MFQDGLDRSCIDSMYGKVHATARRRQVQVNDRCNAVYGKQLKVHVGNGALGTSRRMMYRMLKCEHSAKVASTAGTAD